MLWPLWSVRRTCRTRSLASSKLPMSIGMMSRPLLQLLIALLSEADHQSREIILAALIEGVTSRYLNTGDERRVGERA